MFTVYKVMQLCMRTLLYYGKWLDAIAERAENYKSKERVTYKMIQKYIESKYGFKVRTAYFAEVKRDFGLLMYDAPNAVEKLRKPRKQPTPEKMEAIKDA